MLIRKHDSYYHGISCFTVFFNYAIITSRLRQNRESTEGYSNSIFIFLNSMAEKITMNSGKNRFQQVEHMEVPNGTGQDVRRSKRPLSACHTRRKCSTEPSHNSVEFSKKVTDWYLVLSIEGCHCIWPGYIMSFSIREMETSYCLIRSPYRPQNINRDFYLDVYTILKSELINNMDHMRITSSMTIPSIP